MGALSCFGCVGGEKNRPSESSEPVRQVSIPSHNEKTAPLPRKVSEEPSTVHEEHMKDPNKESKSEIEKVVSENPESNSLEGFKLDLPLSPAVETSSFKDPFSNITAEESDTAQSKRSITSSNARPSLPHLIRVVSSSSSHTKPGSRGSSLQQVSTKATVPPQTPTDTEVKQLPAARAPSPEEPSDKVKVVEASSTSAKVDPSGIAAPASLQPDSKTECIDLKPFEALPHPLAKGPSPRQPQPAEAVVADIKPTHDLKSTSALTTTNLLRHRASCEDDTPVTPLKSSLEQSTIIPPTTAPTPTPKTTTTTTRPRTTRTSTAPAKLPSATPGNSEKRKSRLSRFLTTKDRKSSRVSVAAKEAGLGMRPASRYLQGVGEEVEKEKESVREGQREIFREMQKGNVASEGWENQRPRVEGRKWRDEEDNESLFCY